MPPIPITNAFLWFVAPLVLLSNASEWFAQVESDRLEAIRTIVIDPGHGGSNLGAVGVAKIYERFLTLDTAKRLRQRLQERYPELTILLTREADIDLELGARTHFANLHDADLFLSIHFNSALNPEANGIEVYYYSAEEEPPETMASAEEQTERSRLDEARSEANGIDLPVFGPAGVEIPSIVHDLIRTHNHYLSAVVAQRFLSSLVTCTSATDRGIKQARFRVLRGALMPAVVLELGFLSHAEEGWRVVNPIYLDRLVEALVEGIVASDHALAQQWRPES